MSTSFEKNEKERKKHVSTRVATKSNKTQLNDLEELLSMLNRKDKRSKRRFILNKLITEGRSGQTTLTNNHLSQKKLQSMKVNLITTTENEQRCMAARGFGKSQSQNTNVKNTKSFPAAHSTTHLQLTNHNKDKMPPCKKIETLSHSKKVRFNPNLNVVPVNLTISHGNARNMRSWSNALSGQNNSSPQYVTKRGYRYRLIDNKWRRVSKLENNGASTRRHI
jgi:hypothetical protein